MTTNHKNKREGTGIARSRKKNERSDIGHRDENENGVRSVFNEYFVITKDQILEAIARICENND